MRTHAYFICLTLSFLFTFSNCEKDQLEQGSIETNAQIGQDRGDDTGSCDNIPPQTNFISILFRRPDGSVAPVMCFAPEWGLSEPAWPRQASHFLHPRDWH